MQRCANRIEIFFKYALIAPILRSNNKNNYYDYHVIQDIGVEDKNKYLGLQQILGVTDTTDRKQVEKKILSRIVKFVNSS
jgi:hypothetical protein